MLTKNCSKLSFIDYTAIFFNVISDVLLSFYHVVYENKLLVNIGNQISEYVQSK